VEQAAELRETLETGAGAAMAGAAERVVAARVGAEAPCVEDTVGKTVRVA